MNFKNFVSLLANAGIDISPEQRELPVRVSVSCPETFSKRLIEGGANLVKAVTVTTYADHVLVSFDWDMN